MGRRWSSLQKREVVLRLIKGEDLEALSKEMSIPTIEIEEWKNRFMEAGRAGLRARSNSRETQELREAHDLIKSLRQRVLILERTHVLSETEKQ